jgi:arylsulfatase A
MKIKLSILAFFVGILSLLGACSKKATQPPNFIIIFIDDLGYADIGPFGSTLNRTPNLDRMAAEGMKLTDFYVASSVCTPSRAALMTGCYPQRVDMSTNALPGSGNNLVLFPGDPKGLNPSEITIAEMLKEKGYATTIIGKWHLGDQKQWLPRTQGFDSYFGIPYSNDMSEWHARIDYPPLPLMRNEEVIEEEPDQGLLTKRYTEATLAFIDANKDKPFFVYLPHTMVHLPRYASPDFEGKSNNGLYGDIVEELDWSVGQILDKLKSLDLDKNTLVLFFSDNGGTRSTDTYEVSNEPLRGRKGSMFEGGFRVCSLAWAPGVIPAGSECSEITTSMDLLPTFANLSGATVPADRIIDGKNITPLLEGQPNAKTPHDAFFFHRTKNLYAVRSGPWKLFVKAYNYGNETVKAGTLYNLREDIGETTNVSSKHPDVVTRLEKLAEDSRTDLGDGPDKQGKNIRKAAYIDLKDAVTLTQRH